MPLDQGELAWSNSALDLSRVFTMGFTVSKSHRAVSFFALKWLANHQISDLSDPTIFWVCWIVLWCPPPSWRTPETLRTKKSSWTPPETDSACLTCCFWFQVLGVLGPRLWEFLQSIPGLRNNWWSQLKSLVNGCEWCTSLKNPSCGDLYQYYKCSLYLFIIFLSHDVISCYIYHVISWLTHHLQTQSSALDHLKRTMRCSAMLCYARGVQNHKHCLQHRDQAHALKKGSKLQNYKIYKSSANW